MDSAANFASIRPSSSGGGAGNTSGSTPFTEDILKTLTFLLGEIGYRVSKLDDDLAPLLKSLKYLFVFKKFMLKSPAVPHQWPSFLALIHWLVLIASFDPFKSTSNTVLTLVQARLVHQYILNSYLNYIKGHYDVVEELELDFTDKLNHQKSLTEEKLEAANNELKSLSDDLERLRLHPVKKEDTIALIPC
ncbi:hypothetical protein AHAS_Ahas06G0126000 [Arachis hypogaea]